MAAPPEKTLRDLTGQWDLNKTFSDSPEKLLALQSIGFLTRKAIGIASVHLDINTYEAPPTPPNTSTDVYVHIDIVQTAAGLSSTHEKRCADDVFRDHSDWLFGNVRGKSRWVSHAEIEDEHLKKGWELEGEEGGKSLFESYVESKDNGWEAKQVWGFQLVDGARRYCRNIVVTKNAEREAIRLVYDYAGKGA